MFAWIEQPVSATTQEMVVCRYTLIMSLVCSGEGFLKYECVSGWGKYSCKRNSYRTYAKAIFTEGLLSKPIVYNSSRPSAKLPSAI